MISVQILGECCYKIGRPTGETLPMLCTITGSEARLPLLYLTLTTCVAKPLLSAVISLGRGRPENEQWEITANALPVSGTLKWTFTPGSCTETACVYKPKKSH